MDGAEAIISVREAIAADVEALTDESHLHTLAA